MLESCCKASMQAQVNGPRDLLGAASAVPLVAAAAAGVVSMSLSKSMSISRAPVFLMPATPFPGLLPAAVPGTKFRMTRSGAKIRVYGGAVCSRLLYVVAGGRVCL